MVMFHVEVSRIVKGVGAGGGAGFAQYMAAPAREDLDIAGHAHLPRWAQDHAGHYFSMADRYERQRGIIARLYEVSLPRELTGLQRRDLVDDLREAFFHRHPYAYAIHNPLARDGGEQPHVHLIVSERIVDGIERTPKAWFARAAIEGTDPATGGARKDLSWNRPTMIRDLRAEMATLTNAALEREGHEHVVSALSLERQGLHRDPERYTTGGPSQRMLEKRLETARDDTAWEQDFARVAWQQQKRDERLHDLSREAVVAHVRAHFWMRESLEKLGYALQRERRQWTQGRGLGGHLSDTPQGGVHVHLEEHERGYQR